MKRSTTSSIHIRARPEGGHGDMNSVRCVSGNRHKHNHIRMVFHKIHITMVVMCFGMGTFLSFSLPSVNITPFRCMCL